MDTPASFHLWRPHPWHGLEVGPEPPRIVHAYIEICPFDLVKYEVDKDTGYLRVDRPQRTSSQPPSLYGFIPRTWCADQVCKLMPGALRGDGDPLDICVISERPIARAEVLLNAQVVGGLPMLDGGEADDKIIAVLQNDPLWSKVSDVEDLPEALVDRLRHYFLTYKLAPEKTPEISIGPAYGSEHAHAVVEAAMQDYASQFGEPE
jgi:inorganic pyrophosphatase